MILHKPEKLIYQLCYNISKFNLNFFLADSNYSGKKVFLLKECFISICFLCNWGKKVLGEEEKK
jgi:hypothetical protein